MSGLCEAIWDAEARFGLLDWSVAEVKPWLAGRFSVFKRLASDLALFESTGEERPNSWQAHLAYHSRLLVGALTQNPFRGSEECDVLVFESSRCATFGTDKGCFYTHDLATELSRQGKRVQLMDPHVDGGHSKSLDPRRRFLDAVALESGVRFRLSRWRPRPALPPAYLRPQKRHDGQPNLKAIWV